VRLSDRLVQKKRLLLRLPPLLLPPLLLPLRRSFRSRLRSLHLMRRLILALDWGLPSRNSGHQRYKSFLARWVIGEIMPDPGLRKFLQKKATEN
jgi:hypothetical protein